ncbi:MAG: HDIG domain-containing protein [Syntrophaceae bacterium]|nr:HDIG domain-containing protein [Syntrophaceae bacterium]
MKKKEINSANFIRSVRQTIESYFRRNTPQTLIWEFFLVLFLTFILALLIAPSFLFDQSPYRAGTVAQEDIKADRNFLVEEKLSTEMKKAAILNMTPAVYDYNSELSAIYQAQITQIFKVLAAGPVQSTTSEQNKQISSNFADELFKKQFGVGLSDEEFLIFHRLNFSDTAALIICRLIDKIYKGRYIISHDLPQIDLKRGIVVIDLKNHSESHIGDFHSFTTVDRLIQEIPGRVNRLMSDYSSDFKSAVISLTQKIIRPNLTMNIAATEKAEEAAVGAVKPVYFQVLKNEMIVREGEKITPSIQDKLDAYYAIHGGKGPTVDAGAFVGIFLIIVVMGTVLFYPIRNGNPKSSELKSTLLFLTLVIILQFILIRFGLIISDAVARAFPALTARDCYFAIPFVTGAMLVTVLINDRIAILASIFISLLISFVFDAKIIMPVFALSGSFFVIYQLTHARHRAAFFTTGLFLGLFNGITILALTFFSRNPFDWVFLVNLVMGVIGGIASGIIVSGLLPLFESLFKFTTDIKLLELGNLNQPFFQRMIIETPGTYHHSIVVATLVESAAEAIGANALLAKVSAYYHDIGKLAKPLYFIENQPAGENKHDKLSPKMSSLIIISHVKDGCDFAQQLKLGNPIINIIRQHHGTSLVSYFYNKAKKDPDASLNTLSDSDFRYPGPKPQTKEAGLVLLGDVIEASSRTLEDPTPSRISNLVHDRIEKIFLDGQLDECELTLRDLNKIAESFIRILNGIFHQRISYPEQNTTK